MMGLFKGKRMIVTIVTIILMIIIGVTYGGREKLPLAEEQIGRITNPIQKFIYVGSNFFADIVRPITNVWKLESENELLTEENRQLKNKILDLTLTKQEEKDLKNLKNALRYIEEKQISNYITCNVVAKDPGNWFNMFTIDGGIDKGITKNSTVLNGEGLIGIVYEVGKTWAKVITVIDNKSRVSFEVLSVDEDNVGLVNGKGTAVLSGYLIDPQKDIKIGDYVLVHAGCAMQKIDSDEAQKTLELFKFLGEGEG